MLRFDEIIGRTDSPFATDVLVYGHVDSSIRGPKSISTHASSKSPSPSGRLYIQYVTSHCHLRKQPERPFPRVNGHTLRCTLLRRLIEIVLRRSWTPLASDIAGEHPNI